MKKTYLTTLVILCITVQILAQVPNAFNYQAVIRNSSDELLSSQDVGIRISILEGNDPGTNLFSETHSVSTNKYGAISVSIGNGTLESGNFSEIDWLTGNKYLKVEVDDAGGSSYTSMGMVKLLSVPYALSSKSAENLGDDNIYIPTSDTLFVVKDYQGNVVFAVFPDGAAVYVNEEVKGKIGGFAVSGRNPAKATETNIFRVTPDSTRVFVSDTVNAKGKIGGFAISGRNPAKNTSANLLFVTADSTRVYFNENEGTKGKIGGFAVSGRNPAKGTLSSLMNLTKENYFIGHEAGINNTEGMYNTFLGYNSGLNNTVGVKNIFLGHNSGFSNIEGDANIFIGDSAGIFNESGWHNIFIGTHSGSDNITGAKNISVGSYAGNGLVSGWNNMFLGEFAGGNNSTGNNNIFIGNYSGRRNINGETNVFIGKSSGYSNLIGSNNVFIGLRSGNLNEDGTENIFIGVESGYSNVSGDLNTCIGFQSGYSLDTANYNTFLGFWSGRSNVNGALNTFIGAQAGEFAENGDLNTIVGAYAGSEGVFGDFNTFIGMRAGSKSTGYNNTLLGGFAGAENVDGNHNVFIGQASGEQSTGSQNVFIGNGSGYTNDGDYNVFIGNNAGNTMMGSNKLVIHNGDADSSSALIYGEFDNQYLRFNGYFDGLKFLNSFQIDSNYISEGNYMCFGHSGISEDFIGYKSNTFYFLDSPDGGDVLDPNVVIGGNVGIGVLAPAEKLEVDGNIRVTAGGGFIADATTLDVPDFVFEDDYQLESIEEHALFMWEKKHLPALNSAKEIKDSDGYNISERREQILEELEKAHIYIEQLNNKIKDQQSIIKSQQENIHELEARILLIEKILKND